MWFSVQEIYDLSASKILQLPLSQQWRHNIFNVIRLRESLRSCTTYRFTSESPKNCSGYQFRFFLWKLPPRKNSNKYEVRINGFPSMHARVLSGVLQGSVLGTQFFLIFVNDLPCILLDSFMWLFADDAKLVLNSLKFNDDLVRFYNWIKQTGC